MVEGMCGAMIMASWPAPLVIERLGIACLLSGGGEECSEVWVHGYGGLVELRIDGEVDAAFGGDLVGEMEEGGYGLLADWIFGVTDVE